MVLVDWSLGVALVVGEGVEVWGAALPDVSCATANAAARLITDNDRIILFMMEASEGCSLPYSMHYIP